MTDDEIRGLLGTKMRPGKQNDPCILVDPEDAWLLEYKWQVVANSHGRTSYAWRRVYVPGEKLRSLSLHRVVLRAPQSIVDHVNGNGLDNRRANLRVATLAQNQANCLPRKHNTSGYKGVAWGKVVQMWRAQIGGGDGKRKHLGYFATPEEAAKTYDKALIERFGEYALTNEAMGLYAPVEVE